MRWTALLLPLGCGDPPDVRVAQFLLDAPVESGAVLEVRVESQLFSVVPARERLEVPLPVSEPFEATLTGPALPLWLGDGQVCDPGPPFFAGTLAVRSCSGEGPECEARRRELLGCRQEREAACEMAARRVAACRMRRETDECAGVTRSLAACQRGAADPSACDQELDAYLSCVRAACAEFIRVERDECASGCAELVAAANQSCRPLGCTGSVLARAEAGGRCLESEP